MDIIISYQILLTLSVIIVITSGLYKIYKVVTNNIKKSITHDLTDLNDDKIAKLKDLILNLYKKSEADKRLLGELVKSVKNLEKEVNRLRDRHE
jgi:Na+/H+ antiporter NhaB